MYLSSSWFPQGQQKGPRFLTFTTTRQWSLSFTSKYNPESIEKASKFPTEKTNQTKSKQNTIIEIKAYTFQECHCENSG